MLPDERGIAAGAPAAALPDDGAVIAPVDLASVFAAFASAFAAFASAFASAFADLASLFALFASDFAPYHSFTPLWPAQAPRFVSTDVYVPSLHSPVEPAGACAKPTDETARLATNARGRVKVLRFIGGLRR